MKSKAVQQNDDGTLRALSNRHVQMIAIGGTIGTGLFLGSGSTISKTGLSVILVYLVLGGVFYLMMRAMGEMFYADPSQHTFVSFISKYLGHTVGHFTGWTYWIGLVFVCMAELTAIAGYVQYWFPKLPAWIIELGFLAILMGVNLIAARLFGETEFWFAMIKIFAILAMIATGIFMVLVDFKTPLGHASFNNIFHNFTLTPKGGYNFISAFPMDFFAFLGIEFISITVGEAKNPRTIIKKAVNETIMRILLFYICSLGIIMCIIPWTSLSASSSPFVQVFDLAGFPAAASVINFVVLTSAASSINSGIFSAGRHFYQIATEVDPDSLMGRTFGKISSNGVPAAAILLSAGCMLITPLLSLTATLASAFSFIVSVCCDMYLIVYSLAMVAHRRYRVSDDFLPDGFKMPFYKVTNTATIAFFVVIFISLFFIPQDAIAATGAICWTLLFGVVNWWHGRKTSQARSVE